MALKANYEFLFVGRDDDSFLENYSYDLFKDHGDESGQVFVNLEVQNNPVDAEEVGAVIFETLQRVFFENLDADSYDRFESSLKAINDVLKDFKERKGSDHIGTLNVIVAAVVGDVLYLTQCGDAEAYLIRKRYISLVTEGLNEKPENGDVFSNIASGKIESGDFVLFSSTRLLRYIGKTDLAKAVNIRSVSDSLAEIKDIVSTETLCRIGMTGILFNKLDLAAAKSAQNDEDNMTETVLESNDDRIYAERESISGKFVTALKPNSDGQHRAGRSKNAFVSFLSAIKDFFERFRRNLFSNGFGKDKILAILIVVIIILLIGIFLAQGSGQSKVERERLDNVLNTVQSKIAEAETKGVSNKERAKELLDEAYSDSMQVLNSGYYRAKANIYLNQIEEVRDRIDNVQRVDTPVVLADLSSSDADISALGFADLDNKLFVFDRDSVYEIILDEIQDPVLIDEEETVIAATGFDDRDSVVFLTESGKLIEYRANMMSFMDTEDGAFHKAEELDDWSNKIYLLDPVGNQIWKYNFKGARGAFGKAEPYLSEVEEGEFTSANDLAIDSSIYVLRNNGDLLKLYSGSKAEFYINNPPSDIFQEPTVVFTNDKLNQVFVLDSASSRVFVFDKDDSTGNVFYDTQYLFDDGFDLRDIFIDPDTEKMYVLTKDKILQIDI